MPAKLICVMLLVFVAFDAAAQPQDGPTLEERREVLARFEPYSGHWHATVRQEDPEALEFTMQWDGGAILNGEAYLYRGIHTVDETTGEYLLMIAYDAHEQSYIQWYHDAFGNYKMLLTWAEDGRSYTVSPLPRDAPQDVAVQSIVHMVDDQTMRNAFSVVENDGTALINSSWVAHPAAGRLVFPEVELDPDVQDPLGMMRHHTGRWTSIVNGRATDLIDEPYEASGQWIGEEMVDGRLMVYQGTVESAQGSYEYLWIYTYDENEESYLAWYHDEQGNHGKFNAQWSEERQEMTLQLDDPQRYGYEITFVDRFIDDDTLAFSFNMTLLTGEVVMDENGVASRVIEEEGALGIDDAADQ